MSKVIWFKMSLLWSKMITGGWHFFTETWPFYVLKLQVPSPQSSNWTQKIQQWSNLLDHFYYIFLGQRSLVSKTFRFQKKLSFNKFATKEIVSHRFRENINEKTIWVQKYFGSKKISDLTWPVTTWLDLSWLNLTWSKLT